MKMAAGPGYWLWMGHESVVNLSIIILHLLLFLFCIIIAVLLLCSGWLQVVVDSWTG